MAKTARCRCIVPPHSKRNRVARACDWCRVHRIKCDSSLPCQNCRNRGKIERLRQLVQGLEEQLENATNTNTASDGDDLTIRKENRQVHTRTAHSAQTQRYGPSSAFYFIGRISAYPSTVFNEAEDDHNLQPNSANRPVGSETYLNSIEEDFFLNLIVDEAEFWEHYESPLVDIILTLCMQYGVALTLDSRVDPSFRSGRPDSHVDASDASIAGRWYYRRSQILLVSKLESPSIDHPAMSYLSVNMAHTTLALAVRTAHVPGLHLEPPENLPRPERELRKRICKTCMKLGPSCSVPDMPATCQLPADDHELARLSVSNNAACGNNRLLRTLVLAAHPVHLGFYYRRAEILAANDARVCTQIHRLWKSWRNSSHRRCTILRKWLRSVPDTMKTKRKDAPFICFPSTSLTSFNNTPLAEEHAVSGVNHTTAITHVLRQVLAATDFLKGWYEALQWQWKTLSMIGFILANSSHPSTPTALAAVSDAITVFEVFGKNFAVGTSRLPQHQPKPVP
ncbi:putative transcription factor [Aspergillus novofumigatus IBT 16806]|uniref:Zn(2)-C6 fungal-type domain-containing protein n=1 Tax=Aspergillus novofumigatus (strain IBT 16806) TaxID=1392255 RepID=A0A2I1BU26_ASPN1|nr:uncharacterized protein P174DRAFT_464646 [Aspergillus novofumigatus IBT 16806]PKX88908.1 hypothetical protein P174DRAFT_464646 [Aspergillus novofumigatus IBT 16806]